jgi:PAB1-binding protein PBP1
MSNVGKGQAEAAAKLAAEIEGAAGDSLHAAEERGQEVDRNGLTEEDIYR